MADKDNGQPKADAGSIPTTLDQAFKEKGQEGMVALRSTLDLWLASVAREEFQHLQEIAHEIAVTKGWWETERTITHQLMKIVTELAEAEEEIAKGHEPWKIYYEDGVPHGFPVELADAVIRIFDTATQYNISLVDTVVDKMWHNTTRPYRHGGKAT